MTSLATARADAAPSDATLARRIAHGDTAALEALMRRYNGTLFRTARAILRDDADAEEALQDAYLKVFRSIGQFRGDSKLSTWLVRIAANEALMCRRKRARGAEAVEELHLPGNEAGRKPGLQVEMININEQPDRMVMRGQTRKLLESTIDALPHCFRSVFMLRAIEEFSVAETAEALDIAPATVRTRFFRARVLLRESLMARPLASTLHVRLS